MEAEAEAAILEPANVDEASWKPASAAAAEFV